MKRILLFFFASLSVFASFAQTTPAERCRKVEAFGAALPQEKVYVHLDNTCYFLGDTLWFKAYVTRCGGHLPTDLSRIVYAELLTPDGYFVDRQQLELKDGAAHGAFVLHDSLYAGYYELRAYTLWMLNFGVYEHPHSRWTEDLFYNRGLSKRFFRDYDKIYSRVFPVFDKPSEPGDYVKDMTVRPLRRYFKTETGRPEVEVGFYPEGGNIVAGTNSFVAFEADTKEGRHLDVELSILDGRGDEVARASTVGRGRGAFMLPNVPVGEKYKAVFEYAGYKYSVPLPEVQSEGVAMHVDQTADTIEIAINVSGLEPPLLGVQAMTEGVTAAYRDVQLDSRGCAVVKIPTDVIPTGVCQLTLFDAAGGIYADRLCFVNHHDFDSTPIDVTGVEVQYEPYQEVKLRIQSDVPSSQLRSVSLSVRDRATDEPTYDNGDILTELLLASELKGFVENPRYYFEADDSLHRTALDLLMLVQGWRRYDWRKMAGVEPMTVEHMPEQVQTISGCVNKIVDFRIAYGNDLKEAYWLPGSGVMQAASTEVEVDDQISEMQTDSDDDTSYGYSEPSDDIVQSDQGTPDMKNKAISNLKKEVNVWPTYIQGGQTMTLSQTTENGLFYMQTPLLYDKFVLNLPAADVDKDEEYLKKKMMKGYTDEEAEPDYFVSLFHNNPLFSKPYSYYHDAPCYDLDVADEGEGASSFTDRRLAMVTVRSQRSGLRKLDLSKPAVVVDAYDAFNFAADYGMNTGTHNWVTFAQQVALAYVGDMGMDRNFFLQVRYDGKPINLKSSRTSTAPLSMANGVQMEVPSLISAGEASMERYRHLKTLDKLYIYTDYAPREQGSEKYDQDNQPDVVIDYKLFPGDGYQYVFRDRHYILSGYAVADEFYSPDYSGTPLPDSGDYRRTLYWNPDVALDESGGATVTFYNNGKQTVLGIGVQGITSSGVPVVWESK